MRAFLVSAMIVGALVLAAAPTAEARAFCVAGVDAWCPGLVCTYDQKARAWRCAEDVRPPYDCVQGVQDCDGPPDS